MTERWQDQMAFTATTEHGKTVHWFFESVLTDECVTLCGVYRSSCKKVEQGNRATCKKCQIFKRFGVKT